jgi:hypothetical protein
MYWIRFHVFHILLAFAVTGVFSVRTRETINDVSNVSTPIVLWHGMGDTCCLPFSMGAGELFKAKDLRTI